MSERLIMLKALLKLNQTSSFTNLSRSKIYADIKEGIFPPPIKLGSRSVAWVDHEIREWMQARIAGKTDEDLKELVANLVHARQSGYMTK